MRVSFAVPCLAPLLLEHAFASEDGSAGVAGRWYPGGDSMFSDARCANDPPAPGGKPLYGSGEECCRNAYGDQDVDECLGRLPQSSSDAAAGGLTPGGSVEPIDARPQQRGDFVTYKCGNSTDIPADSLVVDIPFDYEISLPPTEQASRLLPYLEKLMLTDLAQTLGCRAASRRNLGAIDGEETLLGYRSARGDAIEGGSCGKSTAADGLKCVPIVGHVAALLRRDASADEALAAKDAILNGIRDGMADGRYSDIIGNIVYVGEHANEPQQPADDLESGEDDAKSNTILIIIAGNTTFIVVAVVMRAILFGATAFVVVKRRRKRKNRGAEDDEKEDDLAASTIEKEVDLLASEVDKMTRASPPDHIVTTTEEESSAEDLIYDDFSYEDYSSRIYANLNADEENIRERARSILESPGRAGERERPAALSRSCPAPGEGGAVSSIDFMSRDDRFIV